MEGGNPHLCPLCGKPCPLEECVTDGKGRAVHIDCCRSRLQGIGALSFAYSDLAAFRIGMSGSASFHKLKKS
jgi:hypothetical protein